MVQAKVIQFRDWKVQRFKDGQPLTAETVRGATAQEAVERVCGKGLVTDGPAGTHVVRVRPTRSSEWKYYYRPSAQVT